MTPVTIGNSTSSACRVVRGKLGGEPVAIRLTATEAAALDRAKLLGYLITRQGFHARLVRAWRAWCQKTGRPVVWVRRRGFIAILWLDASTCPEPLPLVAEGTISRVLRLSRVEGSVKAIGVWCVSVPVADAEPLAQVLAGLAAWRPRLGER